MKRCQEQRKLPESPFCTRGWMNEGWQRKDQGRVDYATDPEAKDRLWEETRADGGSLEAVRRVVLAPGPPGSLAPLSRIDLVSDCDFWLHHYVAISPQGLDVALYGGLVPHYVVDVGIEDYWFR